MTKPMSERIKMQKMAKVKYADRLTCLQMQETG